MPGGQCERSFSSDAMQICDESLNSTLVTAVLTFVCMCQIKCQRLAVLQSICIQCGNQSGWFLEELWVRGDTDDAWLCFPCHAWLTQADRYADLDTNDVCAGIKT